LEGASERGERAPRRFEGAGERGERAPRRFEGAGERGERAPRRFEGAGERGERAPRRSEGTSERAERAPRSFKGTSERAERAPRRFEGSADRGERAPRSFGDRPPRRDDGERRPFSGARTSAGRPSEHGTRGDRPVRSERDAADRPRFGSDRGAAQQRSGLDRGERGERSAGAPRRFEGERGERSFAKPVKASESERSDRSERPSRAPRDNRTDRDDRNKRGERSERGDSTPAKREFGERPARRGEAAERTARGFDKISPAAARRAPDARPARAGKPPAAASATSRRAAEIDTAHHMSHDTPRPPRRDREDAPGMLRLSKLMSKLGICSRREADEWIEKGWVMVDGERVDTLGAKVFPDQRIDIDPAAQAAQSSQVTVLIHKPVGLVSGQAEDGYQPAITLVTPENRWEGDHSGIPFAVSHLRQLAPAGRLDIDSTGLLVLTQDGRIAKQLIGGHSEVDKEYLVRVAYGEHTVDIESRFPADSLELLRHGLSLDDVPLRPAEVSWQNGEQLRFVLREGKKRQIRRMCELVGLEVVGLKRVRVGRVMLGALPPGQWRYLSEDEAF
jgi:23S rRNA pseudouridine2604 synthase